MSRRRSSSPAHSRQIVKALSIRPVGGWSSDLLQTSGGKFIAQQHLARKRQMLRGVKTKGDVKRVVEAVTPEQKLLIFYETSLQRPLTPKEFREYLTVFREVAPKAYKTVHGNRTPDNIAKACAIGK